MNATEFIKYAALFAAGAYTQHKYTQHQVFSDPSFLALLESALQDSTQEDIDKLVDLEPEKLKDWVMAPKPFRARLLTKFYQEQQQANQALRRQMEDMKKRVDEVREIKKLPWYSRRRIERYWLTDWPLWIACFLMIIALLIALFNPPEIVVKHPKENQGHRTQ